MLPVLQIQHLVLGVYLFEVMLELGDGLRARIPHHVNEFRVRKQHTQILDLEDNDGVFGAGSHFLIGSLFQNRVHVQSSGAVEHVRGEATARVDFSLSQTAVELEDL